MADRRAEILAKLFDVLSEQVEAKHCFRNQVEIPEVRPAIVMFDGDETADAERASKPGRPLTAPVIMNMTPEIHLLVDGEPEQLGDALNALRAKVLKALLTTPSLVALCKDGEVRYEGFATGLASGRSMEGEGGMLFTFVYTLQPSQL